MSERGEWTPEFEGQRPPFEPGNQAARKHGVYSPGRLREIAAGYLERLRAEAPTGGEPADSMALELLALTWARLELGYAYLDEHGILDDDGEPLRLVRDLVSWENSARKLLVELGMTAASRAELRLSGDLIRLAEAQAGFVTSMRAAIDMVAIIAGELLPVEQRELFVREFRDRYTPAVQEALALSAAPDDDESEVPS